MNSTSMGSCLIRLPDRSHESIHSLAIMDHDRYRQIPSQTHFVVSHEPVRALHPQRKFYRMLESPIIHQMAGIELWSIGSCNRRATGTATVDCISLGDGKQCLLVGIPTRFWLVFRKRKVSIGVSVE